MSQEEEPRDANEPDAGTAPSAGTPAAGTPEPAAPPSAVEDAGVSGAEASGNSEDSPESESTVASASAQSDDAGDAGDEADEAGESSEPVEALRAVPKAVAPADRPQLKEARRARPTEFPAGTDLSNLLAKENLDIDGELRRRPEVRTVEFPQVGIHAGSGGNGLEMLMDIRLPITVELGRTQMLVSDILDFGSGTVIELDKLAGDPVDVLVNGKIVAQGEVVVVDDHFGVRITILVSPQDRVRSLA